MLRRIESLRNWSKKTEGKTMNTQYEIVDDFFKCCVEDLKDQIPSGWQYVGSHNDAAPSWDYKGVHIFIDHPDPAERECEDWKRFSVHNEDQEMLFHTDSFEELNKYLDGIRKTNN
tara:strand:+ start:281 stop:628 length:348 start_codon:yes stop_codon:yes gene_type:complete